MTEARNQKTRLAGRILTVDPATRRIDAVLRDRTVVSVAVYDTPSFFRWPKEGEDWIIVRKGYNWVLDQPYQAKDSDSKIEDLQPGEAHVDADVLKTNTLDLRDSKAINAADPEDDNDLANKAYVDNRVGGGDVGQAYPFTSSSHVVIDHNKGKKVAVQVVDSTHSQIEGEVNWPSNNRVIIDFTAAFTGEVYIN